MNENKNDFDCLLKTDGAGKSDATNSLDKSQKYNNTKSQMRTLCRLFSKQSNIYDPKETVNKINDYIKRTDKLDRILYSEISNHIYNFSITEYR